MLNRPLRVLIEGDSLAFTLRRRASAIVGQVPNYQSTTWACSAAASPGAGRSATTAATNDPNPNCETWPAKRAADVHTYDPDVAVLLTGRWEVLDRVHDGQWMHVGEPAFDAYLLQRARPGDQGAVSSAEPRCCC